MNSGKGDGKDGIVAKRRDVKGDFERVKRNKGSKCVGTKGVVQGSGVRAFPP